MSVPFWLIRAWTAGWVLALWWGSGVAFAQRAPEIRAQVDAEVVGVGDSVNYTLRAMSTTQAPDDAQPGATPGFVIEGKSSAPSTSIRIINGVRSDQRTLTTTWILRASKVGTFALGPASIAVDGRRWSAPPVTIQVVPQGQAPPRRPPPQGRDPRQGSPFGSPFPPGFDPFRSLFGFDDDEEPPGAQPLAPPTDPRFALDAPRGSTAFLHATIDKTRAVVGEQVTLSVYLYVDTEAQSLEFRDAHEAPAADFLKYNIVEEEQAQKPLGFASVGGRTWVVRLVRRAALFPLKAGDLEVGAMTIGILRRGGKVAQRASESFTVRVSEPPARDRPAGYAVGDTGRFALKAQVEPRELEAGGAVAVTVTVSGTGRLPATLTVPARPGVDWLEPQVREKLGPVSGDRFGGERTFSYVLKVARDGTLDLGAFTLPYWDPDAKRYEVARAELGTVEVRPRPASAQDAGVAALPDAPLDPFATLGPPRTRLGEQVARVNSPADRTLFWLWLVAPPLAWGVALGARRGIAAARARRASTEGSADAELDARMRSAEAAAAGADAKLIDASTARMLEAAALVGFGLNVRGLAAPAIVPALEERGASKSEAATFTRLLDGCAQARFSPEGADSLAARERYGQAREWAERARRRAPR